MDFSVCAHEVGHGSFGQVWVFRTKKGEAAAVKLMNLQRLGDDWQRKFEEELQCHRLFQQEGGHPNVMHVQRQFIDVEKAAACLVMEAGFMNLQSYQQTQAYAVPAYLGYACVVDMITGLAYVHKHGVIHRDLAPKNIILCHSAGCSSSAPFVCKIADFGLSRPLAEREAATTGFCTPWYRAPEVFDVVEMSSPPAPRYDLACDIWALGCIFAEFVYGYILFASRSAGELQMLARMCLLLGDFPPEIVVRGWTPEKLAEVLALTSARAVQLVSGGVTTVPDSILVPQPYITTSCHQITLLPHTFSPLATIRCPNY